VEDEASNSACELSAYRYTHTPPPSSDTVLAHTRLILLPVLTLMPSSNSSHPSEKLKLSCVEKECAALAIGAVEAGEGGAVPVDSFKPRVESACGVYNQRLKLQYDEPLSNSAFQFQLAPLRAGAGAADLCGRGLHSSTFQLNLSRV